MEKQVKALVLGATGMVGSEVLKAALDSDRVGEVVSIGRKSSGVSHPKLREIEHHDYTDYSPLREELRNMDVVYFCIGVYQGKVPKDEFWKITVDYQMALVRELEDIRPGVTFCLFGAQGADPREKSPFLFAKAKGRAERLLMESRLARKYIFRPGFIDPDNGKRSGFGVQLGRLLYRLFPKVGVDASALGKVMCDVGLRGAKKTVFENRDIRVFGSAG